MLPDITDEYDPTRPNIIDRSIKHSNQVGVRDTSSDQSFGVSRMMNMGWKSDRVSQAPVIHEQTSAGFARLKEADPLIFPLTNLPTPPSTIVSVRDIEEQFSDDYWIDLGCVYGNLLSVEQIDGGVDLKFETHEEALNCFKQISAHIQSNAKIDLISRS